MENMKLLLIPVPSALPEQRIHQRLRVRGGKKRANESLIFLKE